MKSNEAKSNHRVHDNDFWLNASERSLEAIWDNSEDDVYAELEKRDAQGYLDRPQQTDEIDEWLSEQEWGEA